jgi:hypothetical protein
LAPSTVYNGARQTFCRPATRPVTTLDSNSCRWTRSHRQYSNYRVTCSSDQHQMLSWPLGLVCLLGLSAQVSTSIS